MLRVNSNDHWININDKLTSNLCKGSLIIERVEDKETGLTSITKITIQ